VGTELFPHDDCARANEEFAAMPDMNDMRVRRSSAVEPAASHARRASKASKTDFASSIGVEPCELVRMVCKRMLQKKMSRTQERSGSFQLVQTYIVTKSSQLSVYVAISQLAMLIHQ
jgi:hypothetical protein